MKIKKDPDKEGSYIVESASTKGKFYKVDPKKPFCTCPAYRFRGHGMCKHITAVREKLDEKNKDMFDKVIEYVQKQGEVDSVELIEKFGEEAVDDLGHEMTGFPSYKAAELVNLIAEEIQKEDKRIAFIQEMLSKIKEKGDKL